MVRSTGSKPIEDYALIGDGATVALVARDGAIDWLCLPRFDSDACLSALLGSDADGTWRIAPVAPSTVTRRYRGDDLILDTEFASDSGCVRLTDFMPMRRDRDGVVTLVRRLEAIEGAVDLELELSLRFGYGEIEPWFDAISGGFSGVAGPDLVAVRGPELKRDGTVLRASLRLSRGECACYVLQHGRSEDDVLAPIDPARALSDTADYWREWVSGFGEKTHWPEAVKRSLITLKALNHRSTGGIVAAPTLGLPEKPGGAMNWDYRYCWLRDSTFTLTALLNAGFKAEAEAWLRWLLRAIAGDPDKMRIMYRVDGGRRIDEHELEFLQGWNGARPVRAGNAAAGQRQLDVYGEVLDSICLCDRAGIALTAKAADIAVRLVGHVERIWKQPDQGMWESRGDPQHYVYSKVMAWVAVDRLLKLDERHGICGPPRRAGLEALRAAMHADVCTKGFDEGRNSFMQSYGSQDLDASALLLPLVGFLPADDRRVAGTIAAIDGELSEGGFVRRQKAPSQGEEEGVFLACSCWLADCWAMQGRQDEARALFERVLGAANDLDLLSEEYHVPTQRLVGNFPQALTHIAVINTALGLCGPILQRGAG